MAAQAASILDGQDCSDPFGRFLRLEDVERSIGLKKSKIYELMRLDDDPFPAPFKIQGASRWIETEVVHWKARQVGRARGVSDPLAAYRRIREGLAVAGDL